MTKGRTFLILGCAALLIAASDRADAREPDQVTKAALTGHRPHAGDAPQFLGKGPIVVNAGTAASPGSTPSSTSPGYPHDVDLQIKFRMRSEPVLPHHHELQRASPEGEGFPPSRGGH